MKKKCSVLSEKCEPLVCHFVLDGREFSYRPPRRQVQVGGAGGSHVQRQRFLWQASGSEEQLSESLPEEEATGEA